VTAERLRWAQLAQELRFAQLPAARRQAESWRTGLTGLTALLSTVLVIKGRDNITGLAAPYPQVVAGVLGLALLALVIATMAALRAASGEPGDECLLTGEDLAAWTQHEVLLVRRTIRHARWLTLTAIALVAAAVGIAWLAPLAKPAGPLISIDVGRTRLCGELTGISNGSAVLRIGNRYRIVPLTSITRMDAPTECQ
jgi:hypothetical protein